MRDPEPGADWDGFWSRGTDAYFARCITAEGTTHWYRIADEAPDGGLSPVSVPTRVLPFRGDAMRRVFLIVAASPNGRPMLVGSSARRAAK